MAKTASMNRSMRWNCFGCLCVLIREAVRGMADVLAADLRGAADVLAADLRGVADLLAADLRGVADLLAVNLLCRYYYYCTLSCSSVGRLRRTKNNADR